MKIGIGFKGDAEFLSGAGNITCRFACPAEDGLVERMLAGSAFLLVGCQTTAAQRAGHVKCGVERPAYPTTVAPPFLELPAKGSSLRKSRFHLQSSAMSPPP
jgi:hypothetical protein